MHGNILTLINPDLGIDYHWTLEDDVLSLGLVPPVDDPTVQFVMQHDYRKVKGQGA